MSKKTRLSSDEKQLLQELADRLGTTYDEVRDDYLLCYNDPAIKRLGLENQGQIIEYCLEVVAFRVGYAKSKPQEVTP